jgi:hypothetical protein
MIQMRVVIPQELGADELRNGGAVVRVVADEPKTELMAVCH